MKIAKKITQNNEEIKLDIGNIAYKDLQGIARLLGWGIIEDSGSNKDGHYVKYGDGTMICRFTDTAITTPDKVVGSLYFSEAKTFTYPKPFVITPEVVPSGKRASNQYSWANVDIVRPDNVTLCVGAANQYQTRYLGYIAVGRWK